MENSFNKDTLGCQIDEYTRLFGTKETWRKKQTQRQTKVFNKNPPYSFIWPYSFNWHLRVLFPYHSSLQSWQKYNTAVGTQFSITFEVYWLLRTLEVFFKILEEADMVMVWISNLVVFYYSRLLQSERLQPKSSRNENGWL